MIFNFNDINRYPYSDRNGEYGGQAGLKDGILIDGEPWIIKYPKKYKSNGRRGTSQLYYSSAI